jgi:endonuclease-3 related protein
MTPGPARQRKIRSAFRILEAAMGEQHWWPAGSAFEVIVGAYLTQNTAWTNVERAIDNLRHAGALSIEGIRSTPVEELEQLIRPAGYFRQKAARLKRFVEHLDAGYSGSLDALFARPAEELRDELLSLNGIGPETADSILLYAACKEVFVVDAYTHRIFERHALATPATPYDEIRLAVEQALNAEEEHFEKREREGSIATHRRCKDDSGGSANHAIPGLAIHLPSAASRLPRSELARRYNEFHALLVQTAKHFCLKKEARCEHCPLRPLLPRSSKP